MRLPAQDMLLLQQMGYDIEKMAALKPAPRVNLTSEEMKKLASMDVKEALREYNSRVRLEADDDKSVKFLAEVLAERMEVEVPGCTAKLAEANLDAYQGQLYVRKLMVRGEEASLIASMFTETERALYPEYIRRILTEAPMVGLGYSVIDDLIAGREIISGEIGRSLEITSATGPKMKKIAEGAGFPKVTISMAKTTVTVHKHGVEFDLTREVERRATLNLLSIFLRRKSVEFQKDLAIFAANTSLDGATSGGTTAVSGKITSQEFVMCRRKHAHKGYNASVILYGETVDEALVTGNPEIWNPLSSKILLTGQLPNLAGARNLFIPETSDLSTDKLLYIDTTANLIMVVEAGSELAESDYFAQTQTYAYTYSINFALWVMLAAAARKLTVKA